LDHIQHLMNLLTFHWPSKNNISHVTIKNILTVHIWTWLMMNLLDFFSIRICCNKSIISIILFFIAFTFFIQRFSASKYLIEIYLKYCSSHRSDYINYYSNVVIHSWKTIHKKSIYVNKYVSWVQINTTPTEVVGTPTNSCCLS